MFLTSNLILVRFNFNITIIPIITSESFIITTCFRNAVEIPLITDHKRDNSILPVRLRRSPIQFKEFPQFIHVNLTLGFNSILVRFNSKENQFTKIIDKNLFCFNSILVRFNSKNG